MFPQSFLPKLTQRLILRRFIDQDLERFLDYRQDPQVARFQGWSEISYSEAQSFISEMNNAEIGKLGEWFQIAIADKQSNILFGDIGMLIYAENPAIVEIGFTVSRDRQGKGYAKEAVQALIDSLFELRTINKIICITDKLNESSVKLIKRLGLHLVRSDEVEFKGKLCIEQTFELSRKNWLFFQKNSMNIEKLDQYWQSYITECPNISSAPESYEASQFGDSSALADELGTLILKGVKNATCSALWEWEAERSELPKVGLKTIVLDGDNKPLCIIETIEVEIRAFSKVDAQFAYEEGEDDRSLRSWRREHWKYFSRILPHIGRQPTPDMLLVCERFRIVYK